MTPLFIECNKLKKLSQLWCHIFKETRGDIETKDLIPFLSKKNFPNESYRIKAFKHLGWADDLENIIAFTKTPDIEYIDRQYMKQSENEYLSQRKILHGIIQDQSDSQDRRQYQKKLEKQFLGTMMDTVINYWKNSIKDIISYGSRY